MRASKEAISTLLQDEMYLGSKSKARWLWVRVGSPGGRGGTGEDQGHNLWFKQAAPQPPSLHCRGDSLCSPLCRRDPRSHHALTATLLSRENTVRETRKSCNSHAPVGYRRFHKLSHLTRCSNTLQLSDPIVQVYIVLGFLMSQPLQSFRVGKRGHCILRADPPSQPGWCLFSQPSVRPGKLNSSLSATLPLHCMRCQLPSDLAPARIPVLAACI